MATKSTVISPITELETVATMPSMVLKRPDALTVPISGRWPPVITVMKALAM